MQPEQVACTLATHEHPHLHPNLTKLKQLIFAAPSDDQDAISKKYATEQLGTVYGTTY